jgi:hypothetical protein
MAAEQAPEKLFGRLNNSYKSGDFSLVLDLFTPTAVFENTLKGILKLNGPELITDWFKSVGKQVEFVISTPAVNGNWVAVNFDLYMTSNEIVRGVATIEVLPPRDRIKAVYIDHRK